MTTVTPWRCQLCGARYRPTAEDIAAGPTTEARARKRLTGELRDMGDINARLMVASCERSFAGAYDRIFSDHPSRYEAHRRAAYAVTPRE